HHRHFHSFPTRRSSDLPDALLFTEICAMSAIGGHYNSRQISNALTRRFAITALTLLDSVVFNNDNYLRVMRILCCLAVYSQVIVDRKSTRLNSSHLGIS